MKTLAEPQPGTRIAASLLALALCAAAIPACQAKEDNRPPEQIWTEVCATCHAPNGSGMRHKLGKRIDMRTPEWQSSISDEEIADTIRNGKRGNKLMPAFGERFGDAQIDGLVEYVRTKLPAQ